MNRSLVLTAALSLLVVLLCVSPGTAQTPQNTARALPLQVTSNTTPKRDRTRPYKFLTTGRVITPGSYCAPNVNPTPGRGNCVPIRCPSGTNDLRYCLVPGRDVICSGTVTVRYQKGFTTISSRNVAVSRNCTYRSRVTFSTRLRTRVGLLKVRSRFAGNAVLLPRNSSTHRVRSG